MGENDLKNDHDCHESFFYARRPSVCWKRLLECMYFVNPPPSKLCRGNSNRALDGIVSGVSLSLSKYVVDCPYKKKELVARRNN